MRCGVLVGLFPIGGHRGFFGTSEIFDDCANLAPSMAFYCQQGGGILRSADLTGVQLSCLVNRCFGLGPDWLFEGAFFNPLR